MKYIVNQNYKGKCMNGVTISILQGTACESVDDVIYYYSVHKGALYPVCSTTSEVAFDYFSRDDDGKGLQRGKLVHNIKNRLARKDKHQERWNKIWDNEKYFGRFRMQHLKEHWLWNFDFYNAQIPDLELIYRTVRTV